MRVVILPDSEQVAHYGADIFATQLREKPNSVLGLATGGTPVALYQRLIAEYEAGRISFRSTSSFNLDEYWGLEPDHPQSYRYFMNQNLFAKIDIDSANTHVPPGATQDPIAACRAYEDAISDMGGIDLQLLGIGRNGHIGFNEPASSLTSRTRIKTLTRATIDDNARFFAQGERQPTLALTMGIGTILESKKVVLLATGAHKAPAIRAAVEGPLAAICPASALQLHRDAVIVLDEPAASELQDREFHLHIEREHQKLTRQLRHSAANG